MKMRALLSTVTFLTMLICQCAALGTKVEIKPVWQSDNGYIRLFREVGDTKDYAHPTVFHEEQMRSILLSLYFTSYQYFRWSTSTRIFTEEECRDLARPFQQAFMEAGPNDTVEFFLPARTPGFLGITSKAYLTSGRAFVKGETLHFRFDSIQMEMDTHSSRMEDQKVQAAVAWKLMPQEGQEYDLEADILSSGRPNLHWLRVGLQPFLHQAPVTAVPAPSRTELPPAAQTPEMTPTPPESPAGSGADVQKGARARLQELKDLLNEGLITQQDYNTKKQEILDSF